MLLHPSIGHLIARGLSSFETGFAPSFPASFLRLAVFRFFTFPVGEGRCEYSFSMYASW